MAYTRKQKKELRFADALDDLCRKLRLESRDCDGAARGRQAVRRVENRKREQFRKRK